MTSHRQPRVIASVSLPHSEWMRTHQAADVRGQTFSEYCRAVIQRENAAILQDAPTPLPSAA